MQIQKIKSSEIVRVKSNKVEIKDTQSALDFIMTVSFEANSNQIIIDEAMIAEEFFDLKTGLLGDAFQKFITYNLRLAIIGNFAKYNSQSLNDYILESNKGNSIFFVETEEQAIQKLED
ncbi:cytoplasmic protein [Enterococcus sp. JM4C]|uniref:DUF4180 domain-containing protein n=1 Tax=Candidatus Enterococcus huntleyi TaxID=1857217 RepID=UPI00137B23F7|nr:DUF4180 domain-containing protein [Enterococcus sp. JM4C]KAF1298594.1 cytoplasmic protein [Enterococcus sp. JM4C]